jgi:hypothetical protein
VQILCVWLAGMMALRFLAVKILPLTSLLELQHTVCRTAMRTNLTRVDTLGCVNS